ncbi:MAG: AraC family transcriptional regulator [Mucilaginibacter polytrichastri]|nr:AraC family transcriptional regulator [Mucilaginibacter polytrichastri]
MMKSSSFPIELSQNQQLPIRIVSPDFGHLYGQEVAKYKRSTRLSYYFFLFVIKGPSRQIADLQQYDLVEHDLVFFLPNQMRNISEITHGKQYFKLGFDTDCLARLPRQYTFLIDPFNTPKIRVNAVAGARIKSVFLILQDLLMNAQTDPELILAHLHSLLTEINSAYFLRNSKPFNGNIDKYFDFQLYVEEHLTEHHTIKEIAEKLAITADSLYTIVKRVSGLSPKEFITNRLILEARRRLHYGNRSSIKELAFELGFNDPDYFNRVFKKVMGKTTKAFLRDLS